MGGRVWVESEVGKGSTFHLPPASACRRAHPKRTAPPRMDLGGVRVLIMDRNATCRAAVREIFEAHGAIVVEAASADGAA